MAAKDVYLIMERSVDWLENRLTELNKSEMYPFHMPGHKRNSNVIGDEVLKSAFSKDITEIDGFDDLHDPSGIIKAEMDRAATFYGGKHTIFSVNGSTAAILAAISAAVPDGGRILAARNCHRSVYHAICLRNLAVSYVMPSRAGAEWACAGGPVLAVDVENAFLRGSEEIAVGRENESDVDLQTSCREGESNAELRASCREGESNAELQTSCREGEKTADLSEPRRATMTDDTQISAVVITSPTYDGIVSDISEIAKVVHAHGAVLIVDEAHGAHFGRHSYFPKSAVECGADLVIQSMHKTLPALTQTALLHNVSGAVPQERLQYFMDVFETSSPSYVLLSSITACLHAMEEGGEAYFEEYAERLQGLRGRLQKLKFVKLLEAGTSEKCPDACVGADPSKICISAQAAGFSGPELYDLLREKFGLQMEMKTPGYVLAMTSAADTEEGFERLASALEEIDRWAEAASAVEKIDRPEEAELVSADPYSILYSETLPEAVMKPSDALEKYLFGPEQKNNGDGQGAEMKLCPGTVAGGFIDCYPPGIPLIVPGERISEDLPERIRILKECGLTIRMS